MWTVEDNISGKIASRKTGLILYDARLEVFIHFTQDKSQCLSKKVCSVDDTLGSMKQNKEFFLA